MSTPSASKSRPDAISICSPLPRLQPNPHINITYKAIVERALDPEADVVPTASEVPPSLAPDPALVTRAKRHLENFRSAFPFTKVRKSRGRGGGAQRVGEDSFSIDFEELGV